MTPRLRAVIVDDVPLARERVARYLADEPDIEIVGSAATGGEAVRLIASEAPDLAFLDVQLPDFDGFEVVRRLPSSVQPVVIYLTAHGDKALEAFDVSALDCLAKPFDRDRFARALARARGQIGQRRGASAPAPAYQRRLVVREKGRTELIETRDVDYIDVAGHYLCIHVGDAVHVTRGQLAELEEMLDPAEFVRVHRSTMVRLDRVKALDERRNGDCDLVLTDGRRILLSRIYRDSLRARLGLPNL